MAAPLVGPSATADSFPPSDCAMELLLEPHIHDPEEPSPYGNVAADAFYAELLAAHEGLDAQGSALLDARLVLLLANHVGDLRVLRQALRLAREA